LAVGTGLQVMAATMEAGVTAVCAPRVVTIPSARRRGMGTARGR